MPDQERTSRRCTPDRPLPISDDLTITVLGPLLQNAFESAPPGSEVRIGYADGKDFLTLLISNESAEAVDPERVLARGVSTKEGHSGLGLASARRLLDGVPGADLSASVANGRFVIAIKLRWDVAA